MVLVQGLFVTAVLAVLFSFFIAKLVSMAMAADSSCNSHSKMSKNVGKEITRDFDEQDVVTEELLLPERLEVEGVNTEERMEVVVEVTEKVEFAREEGAVEFVGQNEIIETELAKKSIANEEELAEYVLDKKGEEFEEKEPNSDGLIEENRGGGEELVVESNNIVVGQETEEVRVVESELKEEIEEKKVEIEINDDDDWEGIERSELERVFAEAAKYVASGEKDGRLVSDVQMELYGLYKVATEGPCHEQPPMALMLTARAKWNAWQRLGNMSPEVAMEQYIDLVSNRVPEWMQHKPIGDGKQESSEATNCGCEAPALSIFSSNQPNNTGESRNPELRAGDEICNLIEDSNFKTGLVSLTTMAIA